MSQQRDDTPALSDGSLGQYLRQVASNLTPSRYGLLFCDGFSLGVVEYVLGPAPASGQPRGVYVCAPYVDFARVHGQRLTVQLDTGETIDGHCETSDRSPWIFIRECSRVEE